MTDPATQPIEGALLPCPLCGQEAKMVHSPLERDGDDCSHYYAQCLGCQLRQFIYFRRDIAAECWNARARQPSREGVLPEELSAPAPAGDNPSTITRLETLKVAYSAVIAERDELRLALEEIHGEYEGNACDSIRDCMCGNATIQEVQADVMRMDAIARVALLPARGEGT